LIVPVTDAAEGSPDVVVVAAVALAATLGAVEAPPFEQAGKAIVASNASAPMRRDVVMVTRFPPEDRFPGVRSARGRLNPSL
jgi:hypothetical protein